MASTSSSSSSPPPSMGKRRTDCSIRGPRPQPLIVSPPAEASRPSKKPRVSGSGGAGCDTGPVILYELTPRVVHARPEEFMTIVQKLTAGKQSAAPPAAADSTVTLPAEDQVAGGRDDTDTAAVTAADPLVLVLGQQHQPSPPAIDDDHPAPPPSPPANAFLLSPSSLFFSPTTMHALQELAAALL